jgi:hypothetical protein
VRLTRFLTSWAHMSVLRGKVDRPDVDNVEPAGWTSSAHLRARLCGGRRRRAAISPRCAPDYLGSPQSTTPASGRVAAPSFFSDKIPPVCCGGRVAAGQGGKICGRGRSATCSARARRCDLRPERRTELQFRPGHAGGELQFRPSRSGRIELRSGHVRRAPASNQLPSHSIQLSNQSRLQLHITPLICRLIALFFGRIC